MSDNQRLQIITTIGEYLYDNGFPVSKSTKAAVGPGYMAKDAILSPYNIKMIEAEARRKKTNFAPNSEAFRRKEALVELYALLIESKEDATKLDSIKEGVNNSVNLSVNEKQAICSRIDKWLDQSVANNKEDAVDQIPSNNSSIEPFSEKSNPEQSNTTSCSSMDKGVSYGSGDSWGSLTSSSSDQSLTDPRNSSAQFSSSSITLNGSDTQPQSQGNVLDKIQYAESVIKRMNKHTSAQEIADAVDYLVQASTQVPDITRTPIKQYLDKLLKPNQWLPWQKRSMTNLMQDYDQVMGVMRSLTNLKPEMASRYLAGFVQNKKVWNEIGSTVKHAAISGVTDDKPRISRIEGTYRYDKLFQAYDLGREKAPGNSRKLIPGLGADETQKLKTKFGYHDNIQRARNVINHMNKHTSAKEIADAVDYLVQASTQVKDITRTPIKQYLDKLLKPNKWPPWQKRSLTNLMQDYDQVVGVMRSLSDLKPEIARQYLAGFVQNHKVWHKIRNTVQHTVSYNVNTDGAQPDKISRTYHCDRLFQFSDLGNKQTDSSDRKLMPALGVDSLDTSQARCS